MSDNKEFDTGHVRTVSMNVGGSMMKLFEYYDGPFEGHVVGLNRIEFSDDGVLETSATLFSTDGGTTILSTEQSDKIMETPLFSEMLEDLILELVEYDFPTGDRSSGQE